MTQWGVDTLFNPAKRHMDEEKRRLQATRAEVGDNSGGRRIDLESGKVRISRGAQPGESDGADENAEPDDTDSTDAPGATDAAGPSAQAEAAGDADDTAAAEDPRADAASAEDVESGS